MLEMKRNCERCGVRLEPIDAAWICSYECTYCAQCHSALTACPNCKGELTPRPRREPVP